MPFHGSTPRRPGDCPISAFASRELPVYGNFLGKPTPGDTAGTSPGVMDLAALGDLLAKLATAMEASSGGDIHWPNTEGSDVVWSDHAADRENTAIPAGYTYFGQFITHDLSDISLPSVELGRLGPAPTNLRRNPLRLEAILGAGSLQDPHLYEQPHDGGSVPARLKLGVSSDDNFAQLMARLTAPGSPNGFTLDGFAKRDLPRSACPYTVGNADPLGLTDVTIADPRNDDNVIVGQITVLFHTFYNRLVEQVRAQLAKPVGQMSLSEEIVTIEAARELAVATYRDIVKRDYLRLILWPAVFDLFAGGTLLPTEAPAEVPLEYSHAAFRFGHAMIRQAYRLNDKNEEPFGTRSLLHTTSQRTPSIMPLASKWLAQWSRLFEFTGKQKPNYSFKISPFYSTVLFSGSEFLVPGQPDARGLHLLDLQRGASVSLRSVDSILRRLWEIPACEPILAGTRFLADAERRRATIRQWLTFQDGRKNIGFTEAQLKSLSGDPPLLFFVLFEAAAVAGGTSLGPVGSLIVGNTLFSALAQPAADSAKPNPVLTEGAVERAIFGDKRPLSMPELIAFVQKDPGTQVGPSYSSD